MKLSEIIGWPLKPLCPKHDDNFIIRCAYCDDAVSQRIMLTSCDREIDREALAKIIHLEIYMRDMTEDTPVRNLSIYAMAENLISTMPTWLKRIEK